MILRFSVKSPGFKMQNWNDHAKFLCVSKALGIGFVHKHWLIFYLLTSLSYCLPYSQPYNYYYTYLQYKIKNLKFPMRKTRCLPAKHGPYHETWTTITISLTTLHKQLIYITWFDAENKLLYHFNQFVRHCDAWRAWRKYGFGNPPILPWHVPNFRLFGAVGDEKFIY